MLQYCGTTAAEQSVASCINEIHVRSPLRLHVLVRLDDHECVWKPRVLEQQPLRSRTTASTLMGGPAHPIYSPLSRLMR